MEFEGGGQDKKRDVCKVMKETRRRGDPVVFGSDRDHVNEVLNVLFFPNVLFFLVIVPFSFLFRILPLSFFPILLHHLIFTYLSC